ncbi:MAG: hypothetical protein LBU14_01860 [Candidatus Peribacteria bacterium]|jgi:RNase adaptor protein for sRNA GlmZ degradation|nr:hypothetical protein [Candidatus Peribacteria bacterium]
MIKEINLFFFSKIPDNIAKGIIITNCYEEKKDKEYVRNIQSIFNKNGNETFFIRLEADKDLLLNRVENEDRKKTTKIQDREVLKKILKEDDYTTNIIENKRNLVINNSNINVTEVVEEICNFIK